MNRTRLKVSALVNGLTLLKAEFANHGYERHSHNELVLAITESGGTPTADEQRFNLPLSVVEISVLTSSRSLGLFLRTRRAGSLD